MRKRLLSFVVAATLGFATFQAQAALVITEVMSSSGTGGTADWFEVTNNGIASVDVTGYRMDDNSNLFANSVLLRGIGSIAAGESVVFLELNVASTDNDTINAAGLVDVDAFRNYWGGAAVATQIGFYNGASLGVGLGSGGDAVNLYDAGGTLLGNVTFAAATAGTSFEYVTNPSGSTLSTAGVLGAYESANTPLNIGSPGAIANAVPEPSTWAVIGLAACAFGIAARRRKS